jgi:hypothetical protein
VAETVFLLTYQTARVIVPMLLGCLAVLLIAGAILIAGWVYRRAHS